jgi:hypothetical protein
MCKTGFRCSHCNEDIDAASIQDVTHVRDSKPFCSEQCAEAYNAGQLQLPFDLQPRDPGGWLNY